MVYLVGFSANGVLGHKHVSIDSWKNGDDTQDVMQIIANVYNLNVDDIVLTFVFKLPDQ